MNKTVINITKKDLESFEEYFDEITDYPLYASTSGIRRVDGVIIGKIMRLNLDDGEYQVAITKKPERGKHGK